MDNKQRLALTRELAKRVCEVPTNDKLRISLVNVFKWQKYSGCIVLGLLGVESFQWKLFGLQ